MAFQHHFAGARLRYRLAHEELQAQVLPRSKLRGIVQVACRQHEPGSRLFLNPEYGWSVFDALDEGLEGVLTAAIACLDREVVRYRTACRRRRSGGVPDDESAPDTDEAGMPEDESATGRAEAEVADVDPATARAEAEVDTQTADAGGHAGGGSSLRRPRSTRKRRRPEGVAENDGSWRVDMMRSLNPASVPGI